MYKMESEEIPVWSAHQGSSHPRQMSFLCAEARWYLWVQEENKQAISAARRDLLLLHQNGDLELLKKLDVGVFVTALYDNKMIRGRIIRPRPQDISDGSKTPSKTVTLIDVDEGSIHTVAMSQVRKIPQDYMTMPCQAIRCDIGLDCVEQFNWPPEINNMLQKALENSRLLVQYISKRPGSIPTILARINILNPATGQTMPIQKWLMETFSSHLKLCSLDAYKPFPVGMTSDVVGNAVGIQQQQVLAFNFQSRPPASFPQMGSPGGPCMPPRLPGPGNLKPNLVGMPIFAPSVPLNPHRGAVSAPVAPNMPFPMPFNGQPPVPFNGQPGIPFNGQSPLPYSGQTPLPYNGQPPMATEFQPNFPLSMVPGGGFGSVPSHNPGFQHGFFSPQTLPGHIPARVSPNQGFIAHTPPPFPSPTQSESTVTASKPIMSLPVKQQPLLPCQPSKDSMQEINSSLSSVIFESDSDEKVKILSSSSSSTPNNIKEKQVCQSSDLTISDDEKTQPHVSSCEHGLNQEKLKINENTASVKGLNADAAPFEILSSKKERNAVKTGNGDSCSSSSLSVDAPTFVPKFNSSPGKQSLEKENIQNAQIDVKVPASNTSYSSKVYPLDRTRFKTGNEVALDILDPGWTQGEVLYALTAKVLNPSCMEFNIATEESGCLDKLQEEINSYYRSHKRKIVSKQQAQDLCGDYCACYDSDEKIWYRAHIDDWSMTDSVSPLKVWAVDLGGSFLVDVSHIQPLATELACSLPCLVTLCTMKNIQPRSESGTWPEIHVERLKQLLPENKPVYLRIDGPVSAEYKWPVSIYFDAACSRDSVNEILVSEGCASYVPRHNDLQDEQFDDALDPMEEAYNIGGNNYDIDDEDACLAVSGRKVDESGICWFYHREGYCYKNFCNLKHVRLDPDGHSIEKLDVYTQPFEEIGDDFLAPGNRIKLTVTRILTVNHFIARVHLKRGTPGIQSRETLSSVIKNLNSTEMKRSLKTFTEYPADGEIVLFKDETGTYYRGRVLGSDPSDDNLYEILNVDSGYLRKLPLKDLRRVDPAFLHHPFEAVECWLADVSPKSDDPEWVKTCNTIFADLVKDKRLRATIIRSSPWGIEVNMSDKDGEDIAVTLTDMSLLVKNPMRHLPVSKSLPG